MARFLPSLLLLSTLFIGAVCGGTVGSQYHSSPQSALYGGRNYPRVGVYPWDTQDEVQPADTTEAPAQKSGGSKLTAWGIISLIVCVSLLLIAIYYFMLFYPILCKKESKYNVMDTESSA